MSHAFHTDPTHRVLSRKGGYIQGKLTVFVQNVTHNLRPQNHNTGTAVEAGQQTCHTTYIIYTHIYIHIPIYIYTCTVCCSTLCVLQDMYRRNEQLKALLPFFFFFLMPCSSPHGCSHWRGTSTSDFNTGTMSEAEVDTDSIKPSTDKKHALLTFLLPCGSAHCCSRWKGRVRELPLSLW